MKEFRLSPEAQRDLREIEAYLEEHSPGSVDGVLDEIEEKCALLADHPGIGRTRDEIDPGLLSFPAGPYIVFYYRHTDPLGIARILHGSRDLNPAFHETAGRVSDTPL